MMNGELMNNTHHNRNMFLLRPKTQAEACGPTQKDIARLQREAFDVIRRNKEVDRRQ